MNHRIYFAAVSIAAIIAAVSLYPQTRSARETAMPASTAFRILLGVNDTEPTKWDGSVSVKPGRVTSIQGWRFGPEDSTDAKSSWKASTRHSQPNTGQRKQPGPVRENGVIVAVSDPSARLEVKTARGSFSFTAREVPYGVEKEFLKGGVVVERVPDTLQLTSSPEDQDFPAIAQSDDTVYVSYVQFVHGEPGPTGRLTEAPKDFDFLTRPVGGDQVFLLRYSKSKRTWSEPIPVSAPKQDVVRTAVAVDGQKRVWVFWSANQNGNFDIYAKSYAGGRWSSETRLTTDPGTDLNPVAACDAKGRVWVAWQGFRNHNLEILAAAQNGDRFTKEAIVSFSRASDWDPSIAAAPNGEVAVAWDTYDKGDYDVYFRKLRTDGEIRMDAPVPVAASRNFEARSSVAFDPQNRLWVAYEASDTKWGKDFGAYETSGVALYQDHSLRVKCFVGANAFTTADNLVAKIPGAPPEVGGRRRNAAEVPTSLVMPNPDIARNRAAGGAMPPSLPLNSFPRLATDSNGVVYLAFRTPPKIAAGPIPSGTVWFEEIASFDGAGWSKPAIVPNTDGWVDVRAAMVAIGPGDLMAVVTGDHRQTGARRPESINADLYAAEFRVGQAVLPARLKPLAAEVVSPPDTDVKPERDQVTLMRNYRVPLASEKLQIMRGEFHRHTEMSGDGGRDGPLVDAYRYMIDAAYMDWVGCCDHANGGREYSWWLQQKLTDAYHLGTDFVPMFSYERSVQYPEGHRNAVFAKRGIRVLPQLPLSDPDKPASAPDTQMLYRYLRQFDGIVASHTSATSMGTDWRDNDPILEPVVEIYQGDRQSYEMPGAPRANKEGDSIGGWKPLGFVSLAFKKGYRLGFQASSDHISTHMSYCNLWVTTPTREGVMEAFHKRRVYGSTDNILADVRCSGHFMGEEFTTPDAPAISVKLWGTANFAKVHIIRDGEYAYSTSPNTRTVDFTWKDTAAQKGKTSYYYVRGEQADGELVWVSPMWITYQ